MADHHHHNNHHHHQHRPHRLSVPPRTTTPTTLGASPRPYAAFPYSSSTPTPTPSKTRRSSFTSKSSVKSKSSLSFLFLLLFSFRSLYSLLPFLRSSPSFSLFPFSLLVSFLSFFLTLCFSLFSSYPSLSLSSSYSNDPFQQHKPKQPLLGLSSVTHSQQRILIAKSVLLAFVFLLRFQALRYCGTAAMILAEFMGNAASQFVAERRIQNRNRWPKLRGFVPLFIGLFLLAFGWDHAECFPLSNWHAVKQGKTVLPIENCVRIWPMVLPFMSGFLGCYEQLSMNWGTIKQLGHKRVRLITLFFTTLVLFVPATVSFFVFESEEDSVAFGDLAWPLVNTVAFGVLLSENYNDEKLVSSKDTRTEFLVTFFCILVLELIYFPELSLWGLLLCGLLLYVAVRDLGSFVSIDLGSREENSEFFSDMIMKPIRHILSERKSRKIALFLLINAAYMVVEFVAGFMSNSLGLISDACHMLFDCAALAIGLYASYISRLPANMHYNYGRGRFEVLSGYANAVFLVLVGALIVMESFERILDPEEISTSSLLVVSIGGLVVNVIGLIFFHEEHHHAHGGSGSCSHSHSHSHPHSQFHSHHSHHNHDQHCHDKHHHAGHGCSQELISVSGDHHDDHGHHHHNSHQMKADCQVDNHRIQSFKDHHNHTHHRDHHDHTNHHNHTSHHDHGDYRDQDDCHNHHHHDANHNCHEASFAHHLEVNDVDGSHCEGVDSSTGKCDSRKKKTYSEKESQEHSHHHHIDHNMEGIFLHVLADTMGSVGVVISTLLIKYKGWLVADPACSIFISILIVSSVIPLLRNSAEVLLQRVPRVGELELKEALNDVLKIRGVHGIQKFHVWSFSNTEVIGTLHLHVSTDTDKTAAKSQVSHLLHNAGVKDLTLQVESVC